MVAVEAGLVAQRLLDRDRLEVQPGRGTEVGQVPRDGILEREPAFLDEQHHRGRGERLADRAHLEQRRRGHRGRVLDVGHAVRGGDALVADQHSGGGAGDVVLLGRGPQRRGQLVARSPSGGT